MFILKIFILIQTVQHHGRPAGRDQRRPDQQQHNGVERHHIRTGGHAVRGRHVQAEAGVQRGLPQQAAHGQVHLRDVPSERLDG